MPSALTVASGIGNTLLQIILLPVNFLIWLLTSPELVTLICIISEAIIELVVSAVLAGVSIVVSAVIIMGDDPEQPTLTMTSSLPPKSFLYGGDEQVADRKCPESVMTRARSTSTKTLNQLDKPKDTSSESKSLLESWFPKFGAPRGKKTSIILPDSSETAEISAEDAEGSLMQAVDKDPSISLAEDGKSTDLEPSQEEDKGQVPPEDTASKNDEGEDKEESNEKAGSEVKFHSITEDPPA